MNTIKRKATLVAVALALGSASFAAYADLDSITLGIPNHIKEGSFDDRKDSSYEVVLVSQSGDTWNYKVTTKNGYALSHWDLGIPSCDGHYDSYTGGAEIGKDGSIKAEDFVGIKWNFEGDFTIVLDGTYGVTSVPVLVKANNGYGTGTIMGPDCSAGAVDSDSDDSGNASGSDDVDSNDSSDDSGSDNVDSNDSSDDSGSDDSENAACDDVESDSETLFAGGGDNSFTVEFLGKDGNEWSYKVTQTGRALSHWSLGIESCEGHVVSASPSSGYETGKGGSSDSLLQDTGVDWMVKWNTEGGVGDGEIFTLTLDGDYAAMETGVLVKTGGSPQSAVGTITAPNCGVPAPTCGTEPNDDDDPPPSGSSCSNVIYAVHDGGLNNSQLLTIDPYDNYKVAPLGPEYKKHDIEGLDISPSLELYAASGDDPQNGNPAGHLYKVDRATGGLTSVGDITFEYAGQTVSGREISGLSFSPDGQLWGWAEECGLLKINKDDASAELVVYHVDVDTACLDPNPSRFTGNSIEDLTWDEEGKVIYAAEGNRLWKYTYASGMLELVMTMPKGLGAIEMMETIPHGGGLLVGQQNKTASLGLQLLNPETAEIEEGINVDTKGYYDIEGVAWPACIAEE